MPQASARPHPRISRTTDYRQHDTHISMFSKDHPNRAEISTVRRIALTSEDDDWLVVNLRLAKSSPT